jgi:putative NIF3 family GTP cyclohydrolase 1 type 2
MRAAVTRRDFAKILPVAALALSGRVRAASGSGPTAAQVIARLHRQLEAEGIQMLPKAKTVDRFIIGNPDAPLRGIATTFMCSFEVMQRAHAAGSSLIITHEPTFWNHLDSVSDFANDPTYQLKRQYAERHGLTVWRFHDHWHMRRPDPIGAALGRKLGLGTVDTLRAVVEITPIRLGDLVRRMEIAFDTPNLRYCGDPDRMVRTLRWGGHPLRQIAGLDADVFLWPEAKEFNTFDYFRDAQELGLGRCIIGATHELLEEWGMQAPCADWIRGFVPEVPVMSLRTAELYWTV